jgi:hypothetical protein
MKPDRELIDNLIKKLKLKESGKIRNKIFVGFDGYIDKIQRPVKTRTKNSVEYYDTITAFSERIGAAAGKSGQVELVTHEVKLGGNAPIMSNSLGFLGVENYCLGNSGHPVKHRVYEALHPRVTVLSIGNPAESAAIEFKDGKIILSDLSEFRQLDWEQVKKVAGVEHIRKCLNETDLLALVGWCNPDHATRVWKGILDEIMPATSHKKLIFFDLADPTKKSKQDLIDVLNVINDFARYGKVILGLNENETLKLFDMLYPADNNRSAGNLAEAGKKLFSGLKIEGLLIHPVDRSIFIRKEDIIELHGLFVKEPKISTGGGDNLNAGFCFGYLMDFSVQESMILGMATSGAYVKNGKSPELKDLIEYLGTW